MRFFKILQRVRDLSPTELEGARRALDDSITDSKLKFEILSETNARAERPYVRGDVVTKGKISWLRRRD